MAESIHFDSCFKSSLASQTVSPESPIAKRITCLLNSVSCLLAPFPAFLNFIIPASVENDIRKHQYGT